MKAKVVERVISKCSNCEKKIDACRDCGCYFKNGETINCFFDGVNFIHKCKECSKI